MKYRWTTITLALTISIIFAVLAEVKSTLSQVPQLNNREISPNQLEIVKNRADLIRLNNQKVKLIGRYTSKTWKPDPKFTGIPGFQGLYIKSQIVLEDGTKVSIFPSWHKLSLRSPDEAEDYNHQIVEAIGVVQFEAIPYPNSPTRESFIELGKLSLH